MTLLTVLVRKNQ